MRIYTRAYKKMPLAYRDDLPTPPPAKFSSGKRIKRPKSAFCARAWAIIDRALDNAFKVNNLNLFI